MKPHELPAALANIVEPQPQASLEIDPDMESTQGYLHVLSQNFNRRIATESFQAAHEASNELLRLCNPAVEDTYDEFKVITTPPITLGEYEVPGLGGREVIAQLSGTSKHIGNKLFAPPWAERESAVKYRIWVGIPSDTAADSAEHILDTQWLEAEIPGGHHGITDDYAGWLQLIFEKAVDPQNAPAIHDLEKV